MAAAMVSCKLPSPLLAWWRLFYHICRYQEVLEKELMCVALRGSCLTPAFHVRDLQGRGLVACMDTTAGRLVRLAQRK